ncbi:MAG: hypothetical protein GY904_00995 [Planctomycetaceae bacterium]|jgi:hypothetical protein|nr:hypothetical protein [Planctomycetaceae bacterium]
MHLVPAEGYPSGSPNAWLSGSLPKRSWCGIAIDDAVIFSRGVCIERWDDAWARCPTVFACDVLRRFLDTDRPTSLLGSVKFGNEFPARLVLY